MRKSLLFGFLLTAVFLFTVSLLIQLQPVLAQTSLTTTPRVSISPTISPTSTPTPEPTPIPRPDLTQKTEETIGPLERLLEEQTLGPIFPWNPVKYAIRSAVDAGVPANTVVLLLLLPVVAFVIAASRHIIGLRGFGIFLPAALSVVFVALGPLLGIGLFLVIVAVSTIIRVTLRRLKFRLQYLPRMAFTVWAVVVGVLGVLFLAPLVGGQLFINISIFPVLILTLLAEDFTKVQMGKSARTAVNITSETLILALISYFFLTVDWIRRYALLHPETLLGATALLDFVIGRYIGLRLVEYWRFRKLMSLG